MLANIAGDLVGIDAGLINLRDLFVGIFAYGTRQESVVTWMKQVSLCRRSPMLDEACGGGCPMEFVRGSGGKASVSQPPRAAWVGARAVRDVDLDEVLTYI